MKINPLFADMRRQLKLSDEQWQRYEWAMFEMIQALENQRKALQDFQRAMERRNAILEENTP